MARKPKPLEIALAIFESPTRAKAAEGLKISERTLYDYLQRYDVQAAIQALYSDLITERAKRLHELHADALEVIRQTMLDENARTADRLKAACIVLNLGRDALRDAEQYAGAACDALRDAAERSAMPSFPFSL